MIESVVVPSLHGRAHVARKTGLRCHGRGPFASSMIGFQLYSACYKFVKLLATSVTYFVQSS